MDKFNVIDASENHVKKIALLEKENFSSPWSENIILTEINNPVSTFLVCEIKGETVGYISAQNIVGETYVGNIAVQKEYRGQGIASALLRTVVDRAKAEKCAFVTLEVRASNVIARKLYEKAGFMNVGERKNFYTNPTENAVIYTLEFNG